MASSPNSLTAAVNNKATAPKNLTLLNPEGEGSTIPKSAAVDEKATEAATAPKNLTLLNLEDEDEDFTIPKSAAVDEKASDIVSALKTLTRQNLEGEDFTIPKSGAVDEKATEAPKILTLLSSEGDVFPIPESAALLSIVIAGYVDNGRSDEQIPVRDVSSKVLSKIVPYLTKHADKSRSAAEKRRDDEEFLSASLQDLCDYLMAAEHLSIRYLLDVVGQRIADLMKNKSPQWVRNAFGIVNDYTEEEEKEVGREFPWAFEGMEDD